MKLAAGFVLLAYPALAHVMSMSSGDLTIHGTAAHYDLRLPLYEVPHIADPAQSLLAHIRFTSGGQAARLLDSSCHQDPDHSVYVCAADYQFAAPVDVLEVECTFPAVTVLNHVHLLRVENGGKRDQALFDSSFPHATLRFRPPTAVETALTQAGGGALRAWGAAQVLFLVSLVLAARGRRELIQLTAMFLAGQIAAALWVSRSGWQPAARFVEAAAGLTIAYLALEILILPKAGMRWLIVAILGVFHGLYFAMFLRTTGYSAAYVLSGAACAEMALIAICGLIFSYLGRRLAAWKPLPVCASMLLAAGLAWFVLRLRS